MELLKIGFLVLALALQTFALEKVDKRQDEERAELISEMGVESRASASDCCSTLKVSGLGKAITSTTGFGTYTKTYDSRQGKYYWQNGDKAISRTKWGNWYIGPINDRFTEGGWISSSIRRRRYSCPGMIRSYHWAYKTDNGWVRANNPSGNGQIKVECE